MQTRKQKNAAALFESLDPMTAVQLENSRRAVADALFQQQAPAVAQGAFELTGLPTMARGVADIDSSMRTGNVMQGVGGAGQVALGALPFGSGKVAAGLIPFAGHYANKAANMTGLSGFLAQRAPPAAAIVGGVEGTKAAMSAGQAVAAEMDPIPATSDVRAIQEFLVSKGYPIEVDGNRGQNTNKALQDYARKYQSFVAQQNSPEMQNAKRSLMQGQAAQANAEAARLHGVEAARRGGVIKEAEKRYDEKPRSLGEKATQVAQDWAGPVIMGAAALAGVKGVGKTVARRKSLMDVDDLAGRLSKTKTPSDAQREAFVKTYDKAVRGTPIKDAAGTGALYGALGVEMAGSGMLLDGARKEYAAALESYEQSAKGGNLDGGKEKELADRVVKAKRDVEKWERLQGAGLHGATYLTAGKAASGVVPKAKPSAEAAFLRNRYKAEMSGPSITQRLRGLLPEPSRGRAPSTLQQSNPAPKLTDQKVLSGQAGGVPKDPAARPGPSQGSAQGGAGTHSYASLTSKLKADIRQQLEQNGGKLTAKQAQSIAPDVNPERLAKYLAKQREAYRKFGPDGYKVAHEAAPYLATGAGVSLIPFDDY